MTKDTDLSRRELKDFYSLYYSLGYLNTDINTKFGLIAMICHVTQKIQEKKPYITLEQVIDKLTKDLDLPERFIVGLGIVCEDFMYGCKEFPTFGIKDKDMPAKIRSILNTYLPF